MPGGKVIGDQHYDWPARNLRKVKFHVPMKRSAKRIRKGTKTKQPEEEDEVVSKGIEAQRQEVYTVRAKVENRFGIMQELFYAMQIPWAESERQLDCLVYIAAGIINARLS